MARSNGHARAALDAHIARLRTLPQALVRGAAPDVARATEAELKRQIAAGQGPDGEAWQLTQAGERPLKNAAAALEVRALGSVILVRLTGPEVKHHRGTARGRVKRQIIPTRQIPGPIVTAITQVLGRHFRDHMRP